MSDRHDEPPAVAAGEPDKAEVSGKTMSPETESLLGLVDRLGSLLERSDLVELEVESGETGIVLRKPAALPQVATLPAQATQSGAEPGTAGAAVSAGPAEPLPANVKTVKAPLTGVFYGAPSPNAPPFVTVGQHVAVGQVIGLIEAMKLFNEIKSDEAGRVVRIVAETGKLVKAKQPLIEVEP